MEPTNEMSPSMVRELFRYDAEAGRLVWIAHPSDSPATERFIGEVAGAEQHDGYRAITVLGRVYREHRLVWAHETGEWPSRQIDHIDGDRSNNRFENLRLATQAENNCNRSLNRNSKSGFKGVTFRGKKKPWRAQITVGGKQIYLGSFRTAEEAHKAYCAAAERLHGSFARAA